MIYVPCQLLALENRKNTLQGERQGWGWLPGLSVIAAIGLLVVVTAYNGGRNGQDWATILRWIGLLVLFAPISARLLHPSASPRERLGLVLVLGLALYLVKVTYSPLEFKFSDEFQHWRGTTNILETGHLFEYNFILPVSVYYPGLHNITSALATLGGTSVFNAGIIVIGMGRIALTISLYIFYERASKSAYVAGIATMFYMTNPHFQFQNAMFTYQALGLALGAFILMTIALKERGGANKSKFNLLFVISLFPLVITHHITSYLILAFLVLQAVVTAGVRRSTGKQISTINAPQLAVVLILTWLTYVAFITIAYLAPTVEGLATSITDIITQNSTVEETFRPPSGPLLDTIANMGSVGLIMLGLLPGFWYGRQYYRRKALPYTLVVGSIGYYIIIIIRLISPKGAELAGRSWPFIFVLSSFSLAVAAVIAIERWKIFPQRWLILAAVAFSCAVYLGGIMGGWPPHWARSPGPYLASASERSVEPQGVTTAHWAYRYLGSNNRFSANLSNHLLMGSYGKQYSMYGLPTVYLAPEIDSEVLDTLLYYEPQYLLVDMRISRELPARGYYFNEREPEAYTYETPVDEAALKKFDGLQEVSRLFDGGDIIIYDVRALWEWE